MKKALLLFFLLANIQAMELQEQAQTYVFDQQFTKDFDDWTLFYFAKRSLFKALVVQASKEKNLYQAPFNQLIQNIKTRRIDWRQEYVFMTSKDACYRLLSYIPCHSKNYCFPVRYGIDLNGKPVSMTIFDRNKDKYLKSIKENEHQENNFTVSDEPIICTEDAVIFDCDTSEKAKEKADRLIEEYEAVKKQKDSREIFSPNDFDTDIEYSLLVEKEFDRLIGNKDSRFGFESGKIWVKKDEQGKNQFILLE